MIVVDVVWKALVFYNGGRAGEKKRGPFSTGPLLQVLIYHFKVVHSGNSLAFCELFYFRHQMFI